MENAKLQKGGEDRRVGKCRSKPYGTPTRDYIKKALSCFVILIHILLIESRLLVIALKIMVAFVLQRSAIVIIVDSHSCDGGICVKPLSVVVEVR